MSKDDDSSGRTRERMLERVAMDIKGLFFVRALGRAGTAMPSTAIGRRV